MSNLLLYSQALKKDKHRFRDYLLMLILIAVTGMEYFHRSQNYILIGFVISCICFFKQGEKLNREFAIVALLFLVIESFQYVVFGGFNVRTFSGTYIRLFLAFSVVTLLKKKFFLYYVNVIYWLSVISLFFYAATLIPGVNEFYVDYLGNLIPNLFEQDGFYTQNKNIIVYNFNVFALESYRNSGPFWEPGAFAIFLMIALLFNTIYEKSLWSKKNLIFVISIITTFSTVGYLCLFVFILYMNYSRLKKNFLYLIALIFLFFTSFFLYEYIPFLKSKIQMDIDYGSETTSSRFGSAIADFNAFMRSPLLGYGRAGAKVDFRDEMFFEAEDHRNNGVFNLLVTYGIFIFLFYFFKIIQVFKSIAKYYGFSNMYILSSVIIIILLGFSQGIFMRPFFYSFLFIPALFSKAH